MPLTRRRAICLGLLSLAACGDAQSGAIITEHLVIESSDDEPICRGTIDDMEAQAVRVAEALGLGIPHPIHVYYGPSAPDEHCSNPGLPVGGCVTGFGEDTIIAANPSTINHEIVHAVRWVNEKRGPRFFEEGIAEVLSARWPLPYRIEVRADEVRRGPEILAVAPWSEFELYDYGIAGHFTSWLLVTNGDDSVAAFLNDGEFGADAASAFARNLGFSLHDADLAWRSSSEEIYSWEEHCGPPHELTWSGPALEFSGRIDCRAPDTIGTINDKMQTRVRCFTLDQPGLLRVELIAASGHAELHCRESVDEALPFEYFETKRVLAGEAVELPFQRCSWRLAVTTDVTEPTDFSLRVTRL